MASGEDVDLLKRIAGNDQSAVNALYGRYNVRLYRFILRRVRNEAVADELTNEVFMEIWRNASKFEGRSTPSSWIFAIAHNKSVSYLRKRREEGLDDGLAAKIEDMDDTPEVATQKLDKASAIRRAMEKLSDAHRQVIDLVYYQEMSIREVSDIVGIAQNTVKTRMFHARKNLSVIMRDAGLDRGWP